MAVCDATLELVAQMMSVDHDTVSPSLVDQIKAPVDQPTTCARNQGLGQAFRQRL